MIELKSAVASETARGTHAEAKALAEEIWPTYGEVKYLEFNLDQPTTRMGLHRKGRRLAANERWPSWNCQSHVYTTDESIFLTTTAVLIRGLGFTHLRRGFPVEAVFIDGKTAAT